MRIANKLGLTTISIAIAASAVFGYFTYSNLKTYLYEHESDWQRTVAEGLMQKIDQALHLAKRDMRILSEDEFLQNFVAAPNKTHASEIQEVQEELEERLELTGPWQSLIVVDQKGRQILHIHNTENHPKIAQYPESNIAYLAAMKGEVYHSDYVLSDLTDKPTVIFSAPIFKRCAECSPKERAVGKTDRPIVGAIIAHYRWSQIQGILDDAGPNLVPHLFNGKGQLIASAHQDILDEGHSSLRPLSGEENPRKHSVTFDHHQEEPALSIVVKQLSTDISGSSQWRLLLEQPVKTVFQGLDQIIVQITIGLVLSILLLTIVIVTVMQRTIRPLSRLSQQINKIGQGDFDTRLDVTSQDEIGALAENFNQMSEQLQLRTQALQTSEARFKEVAKTIPNILYTICLENFVPIYVSPSVEILLGYEANTLMAAEDGLWLKSLYPEDKQRVLETLNPSLIDRQGYALEYRMLHQDGHTVRTFEDKGNWVFDDDGKVVAVQGILTEISERKAYIDQLQKSSRALHALHAIDTLVLNTKRAEDLVQGACHHFVYQEGYSFVWIGLFTDRDAKAFELTAYDGNDHVLAVKLRKLAISDEHHRSTSYTALSQQKPVIVNDVAVFDRSAEIEIHPEEQRYQSLACFPLANQAKTYGVACFYGTEAGQFTEEEVHLLTQITDNLTFGLAAIEAQEERQKAINDIQYNAFHDALTDLANRNSLMVSLEQAIRAIKRTSSESLALLVVDLDEFKLINDTLGHEAGDKLLQEVCRRIRGVIRESDLLARQGGDEFIIMMQVTNHFLTAEEMKHADTPANLAQRILDVLSKPFTIGEEVAYIGASIGISACPHDSTDAQALLRYADSAMYKAKEVGRGTYQFFSHKLTETQQHRLTLATQLHHALENQEFVLFYQPVIELNTGKMVGVEALIRRQLANGEIVSPDEFLPIAEDTGLIVPIGEWVIEEACRQAKQWQSEGIDLHVAINLSARQFWQQDLAKQMMRTIHSFDLPADAIIVEITETAMSLDERRVESAMTTFHKGGMAIYLDDFGTGYSSLSRLKHMPINTLKIDKTFVDGVPEDKDNLSIVDATLKLAASLEIDALAEGIETEVQYHWFLSRNCRYAQGFYFSPPLPQDELVALYHRRKDWR